jgi:hypothetical protein
MEFTLCLNDHDISVLRMAIDERCSQIDDDLRQLKRISEDEEIPDLEKELRDLRATDTKLAAACSPVGGM